MSVYGIVVAGGQGTRIGYKKQFHMLAGKPMWERSADALIEGGCDHAWIVMPQEDVDHVQDDIVKRGLHARYSVVAGGETRYASVRAGVEAVLLAADDLDHTYVAIHDAARPFVLVSDVGDVIQAAMTYGAALLGQPCTDTIKRVQGNTVVETLPRQELWQAQTPQVFRVSQLKQGYHHAEPEMQPTDDAAVMEAMNVPVRIVPSSGQNLKVTTSGDLELANWLSVQRWGEAFD